MNKNCKRCGKEFFQGKLKDWNWKNKIFCSSLCRRRFNAIKGYKKKGYNLNSSFGKGKKHHFWKGGVTPLMRFIRLSFKYRQWRSDILTRDNYSCQMCGIRGGILEVDHHPKQFIEIYYYNNIKTIDEAICCEEFWNINNGRTLCRKCHNITKSKQFKRGKNELLRNN